MPVTVNESAPSAPPLQTWKLTLAYDGTNFRGWQVQPDERTVQGELQSALGRITGESPLPQGSGRTDAGVHALGQVASFALAAPIPAENLQRALNRTLPRAIRILEARTVRSTFHARHSAVAKTYEYRVFSEAICPPFLAPYVYACPWPMDVAALRRAAQLFEGEHDFLSFAATDPDLASRALGLDAKPIQKLIQEPAQTWSATSWEPWWRWAADVCMASRSSQFSPPATVLSPDRRHRRGGCFCIRWSTKSKSRTQRPNKIFRWTKPKCCSRFWR